ncbi:MAG: 4Fe-4S binding protein [Armatimonadetes bacterium]|nr:4Fe-4S binding protein [Armatimonadota bacterium]
MAKQTRQIIRINEELCNGCGQCVNACAEGALQIVDGKAKLVSETYCDGLGACIGECPQGAITFEEREAEAFDEEATIAHLLEIGRSPEAHYAHMAEHGIGGHDHGAAHGHSHGHGHGGGFVCPSARTIDRRADASQTGPVQQGSVPSELRQWPVKLYLVNPRASFLQDSDLLLAADCTAFTYGAFHPDLLRGKTLVTGCPKFDDVNLYLDKLTEILRLNNVISITVVKMEVPCCSGLVKLAQAAVEASGRNVPVKVVTIGLSGELIEENSDATFCLGH